MKLTLAETDPIVGRRIPPPPPPELIDGEEEWVVEEILDSKVINRKLRYLIKWKGFGIDHNSWEPWDNVSTPNLVADFYRRHPGAARHIWSTVFHSLPFRPTIEPRRHDSEGGWMLGDTFSNPLPLRPLPLFCPLMPPYVLPHRRTRWPLPSAPV